jgi:hypothetical protein
LSRLRAEHDILPWDIVMIRVNQRKDHRETRTLRISASSGSSTAGFDKSKLVRLKVNAVNDFYIDFEPAED